MILKVPRLWDYEKYGPGNVVEWFKREGEETSENDLLCQIMVVKATNNVYSEKSGVLQKIIAEVGAEVRPGDELAEFLETGTSSAPAKPAAPSAQKQGQEERTPATPSARRVAREKGINLSSVRGTGKGGLITGEDVMLASQAQQGAPESGREYTSKKMSGLRKATADVMMRSIQGSAQLTLHMYADVTKLVQIREARLKDMGLSYNDILAYYAIRALEKHPELNAHLMGENEIREYRDINLGISIQTDDGLYSAVLRDAGKMKLMEISSGIYFLIRKARERSLHMDDLQGSTFTLSNLGMAGIELFTPIINPPEVAILGVGSIGDYITMSSDGLSFRKRIGLSLTIDHRAIDGFTGAVFLQSLRQFLENPEGLP